MELLLINLLISVATGSLILVGTHLGNWYGDVMIFFGGFFINIFVSAWLNNLI